MYQMLRNIFRHSRVGGNLELECETSKISKDGIVNEGTPPEADVQQEVHSTTMLPCKARRGISLCKSLPFSFLYSLCYHYFSNSGSFASSGRRQIGTDADVQQ
jgi:hypothetical protein